jgi:hypothetical protein
MIKIGRGLSFDVIWLMAGCRGEESMPARELGQQVFPMKFMFGLEPAESQKQPVGLADITAKALSPLYLRDFARDQTTAMVNGLFGLVQQTP